jgi:predicted aconitase with swiveling domain
MNRSGAFEGRALLEGAARGAAVVLEEPLSLWGGMDQSSGRLIDHRHPQAGAELSGRIVVMPSGRGSSSSSSVLAEAIRAGTAPAGIILLEPDGILVLGALVARELYGRSIPVIVLRPADYAAIETGDEVVISSGRVIRTPVTRR